MHKPEYTLSAVMVCANCGIKLYVDDGMLLHVDSKLQHCDSDFDDLTHRNQKMAKVSLVVEKVKDAIPRSR